MIDGIGSENYPHELSNLLLLHALLQLLLLRLGESEGIVCQSVTYKRKYKRKAYPSMLIE